MLPASAHLHCQQYQSKYSLGRLSCQLKYCSGTYALWLSFEKDTGVRKRNLPAGTAVLGSAGATTAGACNTGQAPISPGTLEAESRQKLFYGTAPALGTLFRQFVAEYQVFKVMLAPAAMKFINRHL
jgi:hypothetical protein